MGRRNLGELDVVGGMECGVAIYKRCIYLGKWEQIFLPKWR